MSIGLVPPHAITSDCNPSPPGGGRISAAFTRSAASLKRMHAQSKKKDSVGSRFLEADEVYNVPELLGYILSFCDWRTVMAVSRADDAGRVAARWAVQERIRSTIHPFVASENFHGFLKMLQDTGAGVVGSNVRRMLACNSGYDADIPQTLSAKLQSSHDLNMLVHAEQADSMVDWFTAQGYGGWKYIQIFEGYASSVDNVLVGILPKLGQKVRSISMLCCMTLMSRHNIGRRH